MPQGQELDRERGVYPPEHLAAEEVVQMDLVEVKVAYLEQDHPYRRGLARQSLATG
jgi:hypothetical protein